ncbi:MAG: cytochrome C oxidase subunit IV family protein [Puniceicoccaceae bacterium]
MSEAAHPTASITKEFLAAEQKKYFTFVNLAFLMTALTGIELVLVFLPLPKAVIYSSLLGMSLVKFVAVILWFMHLIYDRAVLTLIFLFGMAITTATIAALLALLSNADVDKSLPFYEPRDLSEIRQGH